MVQLGRIVSCSLVSLAMSMPLPAVAAARTSAVSAPAPDPSWEEPAEQPTPPTKADPEPAPPEVVQDDAPPAVGEMPPETEALLRDEQPPATVEVPPPVPPQAVATQPQPLQPMRPMTRKGTGLIVTSAVVGTLAIGTAIGRMVAVDSCLDGDAIMTSEDYNISTCIRSSRALLGLTIPGWFLNVATWGLAPAAGAVRGKHDGTSYAWDGRPKRVAGAYIGTGAAVLALGIIGWTANRVTFFRVVEADSIDGFRNNMLAYFGVLQLTSSMIAVGGGLLAYGASYHRTRKHYGRELGRQVRIVPQLDRRYSGLSLSGRF